MVNILNRQMIKHALGKITESQRRQLMYAFNEEIPQHVVLEDGVHFLGVHCEGISTLEIIETAGAWSYGRIRV